MPEHNTTKWGWGCTWGVEGAGKAQTSMGVQHGYLSRAARGGLAWCR